MAGLDANAAAPGPRPPLCGEEPLCTSMAAALQISITLSWRLFVSGIPAIPGEGGGLPQVGEIS